jgi:2-polyprenyl-3-methyl-5-hydroxy-6-metoxy-1,4-benzoquinol methylase
MISRPSDQYVVPAILKEIKNTFKSGAEILDVGCGDGYAADQFRQAGWRVRAFDVSEKNIELARGRFPGIDFTARSLYDDLAVTYGTQQECVTALEVIEHLYYPRRLFEQSHALLRPGGWLILSTPYHGYWKNLALSLLDGWDNHFSVEWDGGHVKFFSKKTLMEMARAAGFQNLKFSGAGRLPYLWKSMILLAQKK